MKRNLSAAVIDDDAQVRRFVADILTGEGWNVVEAANAEEAFAIMHKRQWTLVFCDVMLGDINGYEVLRRYVIAQPQARFILMTGYESAAGALDATATGAYDYLVKPFTVKNILAIATAVEQQHRAQLKSVNREPAPTGYLSDINLIGRSPNFVECMKLVGRVAATNLPVLITGESGTGKEMVARAIHKRSSRAAGEFIAVNCSAIPFELIESELFGHARGSFTGADRERVGLWEEADGGTILLDEITETSPLFQVKLLRALQEGEIRRVGSNRTLKVDVRVIAATNRDIEEESKAGRFRQDLMYRLNTVAIDLPPLRERVEDIPILAEHFAARVRPADAPAKFSAAAVEILRGYHWEGNIRELENAVLHAVSLADQNILPEHLPARIQNSGDGAATGRDAAPTSQTPAPPATEWLSLAELEAKYVAQVLAHTSGNKQAAAHLLGIDRKRLTRIIKRYNLDFKLSVTFDKLPAE